MLYKRRMSTRIFKKSLGKEITLKLQNWAYNIEKPGTLVRILRVWEWSEESSWDSREYTYTMTRVVCIWFSSTEFCVLGFASRAEIMLSIREHNLTHTHIQLELGLGELKKVKALRLHPGCPLLWQRHFLNTA